MHTPPACPQVMCGESGSTTVWGRDERRWRMQGSWCGWGSARRGGLRCHEHCYSIPWCQWGGATPA